MDISDFNIHSNLSISVIHDPMDELEENMDHLVKREVTTPHPLDKRCVLNNKGGGSTWQNFKVTSF